MWSELKGFIPTPLIFPNSATADWGRGFWPPPLPNHSAIEAAESGRPTDDEHGDEGEFNGTRGIGLNCMFPDPFLLRVAVTVGKGSGYAKLLTVYP